MTNNNDKCVVDRGNLHALETDIKNHRLPTFIKKIQNVVIIS